MTPSRIIGAGAMLFLVLLFSSCSEQENKEGGRRIVLPSTTVHEGWYFGTGELVGEIWMKKATAKAS